MIGRIRGILLHKEPPTLLVDVNGVGYEIEAPMSVFYDLPQNGESVTLITHHLVREDAQILYGFLRESHRQLFRNLLKVSGIGAKSALAILSVMSASEFASAIHHGDVASLVKIPGIGKKTAERLIVEMRDRLDDSIFTGDSTVPHVLPQSAEKEAISALQALGYKAAEAEKMIKKTARDGASAEELIRLALQQQGKKA
jgi:Holliday junction DNA helicase RuvA